jgi:Lrp/AsnC family transcriptional regulator for asnA, asnC and gidA
MSFAYVLINVEMGQDENVHKILQEFDEVKEAYMLYGVYDILVKIETKDMDNLKDTISSKLRSVSGIRSTLTMIVTGT